MVSSGVWNVVVCLVEVVPVVPLRGAATKNSAKELLQKGRGAEETVTVQV